MVMYTGVPYETSYTFYTADMTEEEIAAITDEQQAEIEADVNYPQAKFLVGFGGYDDASNGTPDNYLTLPSEIFAVDMMYPEEEADSAIATASLVAACAISLVTF